jgi:hypothetical protein
MKALRIDRLRLFGLDTAAFALDKVAELFTKFGPLFESQSVKPPAIAARYSLSAAAQAYEAVDRGLGKVVLVPQL